MMYVVVFFEEYVGHHFDEYSKAFSDEKMAQVYCDKLNADFAKVNGCSVEDLGDYYEIEKVSVDYKNYF